MLAQLKSLPAITSTLKRPPYLYGKARKIIQRVQSLDIKERQEFQRQRLDTMLSIAKSLPGYKDKHGNGALETWPVLEKSDVAGKEALFLPRSLISTGAATGGTTGKPLNLRRSLAGVAFEQAHIDLLCENAGVSAATARTAVLRGDSIIDPAQILPPFWKDHGARKRIFSAHHLSDATLDSYLPAIAGFKPDILFCYPSTLRHLTNLIENARGGRQIEIPLIFASSEVLDSQTALAAKRIFGAKIIDFYGHAERVASAYSDGAGGFWFDPAYGHVELAPCGENKAEIIATSLWPNGQIFIRYRTGDIAQIESRDSEYLRSVSLGVLPFPGIEGRNSEYIETTDGRRIIGLNHLPRGVSGIQCLQLHQVAGCVRLYITPSKEYGTSTLESISRNIAAKFPPDTRFEWFMTDAPLREASGKAPLLLRNPVNVKAAFIENKYSSFMEPV